MKYNSMRDCIWCLIWSMVYLQYNNTMIKYVVCCLNDCSTIPECFILIGQIELINFVLILHSFFNNSHRDCMVVAPHNWDYWNDDVYDDVFNLAFLEGVYMVCIRQRLNFKLLIQETLQCFSVTQQAIFCFTKRVNRKIS